MSVPTIQAFCFLDNDPGLPRCALFQLYLPQEVDWTAHSLILANEYDHTREQKEAKGHLFALSIRTHMFEETDSSVEDQRSPRYMNIT